MRSNLRQERVEEVGLASAPVLVEQALEARHGERELEHPVLRHTRRSFDSRCRQVSSRGAMRQEQQHESHRSRRLACVPVPSHCSSLSAAFVVGGPAGFCAASLVGGCNSASSATYSLLVYSTHFYCVARVAATYVAQ